MPSQVEYAAVSIFQAIMTSDMLLAMCENNMRGMERCLAHVNLHAFHAAMTTVLMHSEARQTLRIHPF